MKASQEDFYVSPSGGALLAVVASVVFGYHFGQIDGASSTTMIPLVHGFLLVFALVFLLRFVFFLSGKQVGIKALFNLVVFSLFLPVSFALWLASKGLSGATGLLLAYSIVCMSVSCVRIFLKAD